MARFLTYKSYPYKHWLTSIILVPIFSILYNFAFAEWQRALDSLKAFPIFFLIGIIMSIPTFVIYLILFIYLDKYTNSEFIIKSILNLVTFICMFLTFLILGSQEQELATMYTASVLITSFFYRINEKNTKQTGTI